MKKYLFNALALLVPCFYMAAAHAACVAVASNKIGVEGNILHYRLSSPLISVDPDAPTGSILWTRNIDSRGPKWVCAGGGQAVYKSKMGAAFSQIVGSNLRGNIYSTGIEGLGIQISDLFQSNKAAEVSLYPTAQQLLAFSSSGYTRIDFIKVGPIGSGDLKNGVLATYTIDGVTVMDVSILGSRFKYKSCTIDGQYNRTIPLGSHKNTDIKDTSPDVPFEMKLKCQADAVPVYVTFDAVNGSSGAGLLTLDQSVDKPATGVAVEILDANTNSPLQLGQEVEYHKNQETAISIPLIAHYKKIASTITPGPANASMTITISER